MDATPERFTDIANLETYLQIRPLIREFIIKQLESYNPMCIITIARKSKRILHAVMDQTDPWYPLIKNDYTIHKEDVEGKHIVIFDDSLHTGQSVCKCVELVRSLGTPADILIITVLSNKEGHSNLLGKQIPKDNIVSYRVFDTYDEQTVEYTKWMYHIVSAPKNKLGNEYISEKLTFECELDTAVRILTKSFREENYIPVEVGNFVTSPEEARNISFIPETQEEVFDGCLYTDLKIRTNIYHENGQTHVVIEYLVAPEDISDLAERCSEEDIAHRLFEYDDKEEVLCRSCILLQSAVKYIRRFESIILRKAEQENLKVGQPEYYLPPKEPYPEELRTELDVYQQWRI